MSGETLPPQIADQMRRDILRGRLAPGAAIKEREQALARGVSRTPMREAIRILADEGLVTLRPARSPVVANPSLQQVADDIEVLRALELLSGKLACARATDADIAEIRAVHEKMARLYSEIDTLELFEIDMSFHLTISRASHNPSLIATHRAYLARLWRVRYLSASQRESRERVLRQHGAMVEGLVRRDPDLMQREITAHLDAMVDNIRRRFEAEARAKRKNARPRARRKSVGAPAT